MEEHGTFARDPKLAKLYDKVGPVDVWTQRYLPRQRALFHAMRGAYVSAELDRLNEVTGANWKKQAIEAAEWRAAGVYAAAWLKHPDRLARDIPPPAEATFNRDVVCAVLAAVRKILRDRSEHDFVFTFDVPAELATDPDRLSKWRACARRFGRDSVDRETYFDWLTVVRRTRADYETSDGADSPGAAVGQGEDPDAESETGIAWTTAIKNYYAGTGNTIKKLPLHDRMNAQIDTFFLDRYADVEWTSPVDLLGTFPLFDLPHAAELTAPDRTATTSNTAYDWAVRLRDLAWHMAFQAALETDYPAQAADVAVAIKRVKAAVDAQYESPTSVASPRPPAVGVIDDVWTGLGPVGEQFFDAVVAHVRGIGDDGAAAIPTVAESILRWLHDGRSALDELELFAAVNDLAPAERGAVATLAQHAIQRALQLAGDGDGDGDANGDRR